ncbi:aldo/keto reductase [Actinoplanes sp. NEAU-A12]|uniref:Aldo/keto reductase n=1 Tax=Actinoplanes sandaracinus TaxID=3045177 RepID=A0ABT6X170_9ACTN|nr:aldo/keto reductase [Actinoplanes sandaracinus]MDI6105723.1 aldo/keto reductase [Actinoplanes sandaracinus]
MEQRMLGRTGREVGVIGLGTWQLGADWGDVSEPEALATLAAAADSGVTLFDTADAYGDGLSEQLIGRFLKERPDAGIVVATKVGRRVMPQHPELYRMENLREWVDRSRSNLGVDRLDLVQLHCPPTAVYSTDAVFDALDTLVEEERIAAYGVSVETRQEALAAIARPGVASVQLVLNMLRQAPLQQVLPAARAAGVAIIARVPLASGLLSGRYDLTTTFAEHDHRHYNRDGAAFDIGETFAGVPYEIGLEAVRRLAPLAPAGATMAQFALRWVIDQPGVSAVIPGARTARQAQGNAASACLPPLSAEVQEAVRHVYDEVVAPSVADRW